MFVFLLGGVDFLLLFLLATVEGSHDVGVGSLEEHILSVFLSEVGTLGDQPGAGATEGKELNDLLQGHSLCGAVELVQPDLHVANYIKIYLINQRKIIFNINWDSMLTLAFHRLVKQQVAKRLAYALATKKESAPPTETSPNSQQTTAESSNPAQQQQSQPTKESLRLKRDRFDEEDEAEEQPLHSENRNTLGWWIYRFFFWGSTALLTYDMYLVYNHKKKTPVQDEPGTIPYFIIPAKWIVNNVNDFIEFVTEPPSKKLLYDPVHPDLHPKTLVLNLTGTLLQSEYIFGKGAKTTLRPGLQNMLRRLAQKYEIVIFAEEDEMSLMPKLMKVDPKQMYLRGMLGRESMVWKGGQFVKDLRYLNRDLKKVVAVDRSPDNVKNQPQNTIIIPDFTGDENDNQLAKLTLLLQKLVEVPDVRKFLSSLGSNPVQTYYQRAKQAQEKISKKANMFGMFGQNNTKKQKE